MPLDTRNARSAIQAQYHLARADAYDAQAETYDLCAVAEAADPYCASDGSRVRHYVDLARDYRKMAAGERDRAWAATQEADRRTGEGTP